MSSEDRSDESFAERISLHDIDINEDDDLDDSAEFETSRNSSRDESFIDSKELFFMCFYINTCNLISFHGKSLFLNAYS